MIGLHRNMFKKIKQKCNKYNNVEIINKLYEVLLILRLINKSNTNRLKIAYYEKFNSLYFNLSIF